MAAHVPSGSSVELVVADEFVGWRLDWFLAHHFRDYSRMRLRRVINDSHVSVDGRRAKASLHLRTGQGVTVTLPEVEREMPRREAMELDILYEDDLLVAVNKPAGMVVHPARGNWAGTLVSGLQFHFDELSTIGGPSRPGIVHRLDRETSGVIVVAKNDFAHSRLADQFQNRTVEKEYLAITVGSPDRDRDFIDQPIGVHPHQREKMAIRRHDEHSRPARTFYHVEQRFRGFAHLQVLPHTGRTHQIRVHLAHIGCPVLCDRQYGGRHTITRGELAGTTDPHVLLERHGLHALRLKVAHPQTGEPLEFRAPLTADMQQTLAALLEKRGPCNRAWAERKSLTAVAITALWIARGDIWPLAWDRNFQRMFDR